MSLTIHFTDKNDWKMSSKCLQTYFFPEDHNADNIAEALQEAMQEWNLDPSKLSAVTTNNGANYRSSDKKTGLAVAKLFRP